MKKLVYLMAFVAMVFGMMGCSLITQSNNEYWIHDWGHDGYDYLWLKPNGKCNYYLGLTEHTNCKYTVNGDIVTIFNEDNSVERTFNKQTGLLYEPGEEEYGVYLSLISEEEFKEFVIGRDMYGSSEDMDYEEESDDEFDYESDYEYGTSTSGPKEEFFFRSAYDVMDYLSSVTFTDVNDNIRLQFKYDGLYANNTPITGAIEVVHFAPVKATLTCVGIDGSRFRFQLVHDMLVKELNSGEIYFVVK